MSERIFFRDSYHDVPATRRGRLVEEVRRAKMQYWSDPGDTELRERIAEAEAALRAFDDARGAAR